MFDYKRKQYLAVSPILSSKVKMF